MKPTITMSLGIALTFCIGFGGMTLLRMNSSPAALPNPRGETETALILLVSPTCAASNDPKLPVAWKAFVAAARSDSPDFAISLIGVAMSSSPARGLDFLDRFGLFNEVTTGRGYFNTGGLRYMLNDFPGPAILPQVVVVRRQYAAHADGTRYLDSEVVVRRIWGLDDIVQAADRKFAAVR
ncbi:MAG TPA: hypothetical protein VMN60_09700 [Longimicrobiales bacterium]|nr:hypothetical protein [Longimicrobiales bacterium]